MQVRRAVPFSIHRYASTGKADRSTAMVSDNLLEPVARETQLADG
jgi:hypothetical protein